MFEGLPNEIEWRSRLTPKDEPGESLIVEGVVKNEVGATVPGVVIYAYQTDKGGIYPRIEALEGTPAHRHGKLRNWVKTDAEGRYRFDTIRPGSYPNTQIPSHIHMHVIESGRCTYYIDDINFTDDPFFSKQAQERESERPQRGGSGMVTPKKNEDGVWHVTRNIVLGEAISDYDDCLSP